MIDLSFTSKLTPEKGCVLISDPFAGDNYFTRSVVLLCDHDEGGTFGFVLTNYLESDLKSFIPTFPFDDFKVAIGGPVDTESLFFFHTFGEKIDGATKINDSLYYGGNFKQLVAHLEEDENSHYCVRFFLGYAGWASDQLKDEIAKNGWVVADNFDTNEIIDTRTENLWQTLMEKQGSKFKLMANYPLNPMNN